MKRVALCVLAVMLFACGCAQTQEDPFRVDTVVQIPVDPTDAPTEESTEPTTEEPAEEAPTVQKETEPKKTTSYKESSSGKSSSSGKTSSGKTQAKATEPPVTETVLVETAPPTEAPTEPPFDPASYDVGSLEYAILGEMNAYRAEVDAPELSMSGKLSGIAYLRAQEICSFWSHTRPDGRSYTSALADYGYGFGTSAELLIYASGSGDSASMVAKWMGSETHSANILSASFAKVGIGAYRIGGMTYVACLLVG